MNKLPIVKLREDSGGSADRQPCRLDRKFGNCWLIRESSLCLNISGGTVLSNSENVKPTTKANVNIVRRPVDFAVRTERIVFLPVFTSICLNKSDTSLFVVKSCP